MTTSVKLDKELYTIEVSMEDEITWKDLMVDFICILQALGFSSDDFAKLKYNYTE